MQLQKDKLGVEEFGRALITSGDLDPVYIMLHHARMEPEQLHRWLIAYWCFYSCGAASWLSQFEEHWFWSNMLVAAHNTTPTPLGGRWPRGAERRHFRGQQGIDSITELSARYPVPEKMVSYIAGSGGPFAEVAGRAQEHRGFGPWISFKIADMVDRVLLIPVDFTESAIFMFKDPAKAAEMVWEKYVGPVANSKFDAVERRHRIVQQLTQKFSDMLAPPAQDRPINIQEVETVLCKWKSHMNGHYPVGKDTHEIREALVEWSACSATAAELAHVMAP